MQKELDNEFWEKKDIRIARQSSWKDSCELVAAFTNAGFYKDKAEAMEDAYGIKNMIMDDIYKDMDAFKGTVEPRQAIETKKAEQGTSTDGQRRAVFAIIYGDNGNPDLEKELPTGINRFTLKKLGFEDASNFIEKHKSK